MKTLFQMGFPVSFSFWEHQNRPWPILAGRRILAQATPTGDLDQAAHDALYAKLKAAVDHGTEVDSWIHSVGDQQANILGDYYTQFRAYVDEAANLATDVYPIYQRLQSDNIEDWWVADPDAAKIDRFLVVVDGAYQIYLQRAKAAPAPSTPASYGPPQGIQTGPITQVPAARPPGAPVTPGAKPAVVTPPAAAKGILPQPGISTNDLLLGGGIAAGVGAVLYAVLRKG